jgi:hypothetical protein
MLVSWVYVYYGRLDWVPQVGRKQQIKRTCFTSICKKEREKRKGKKRRGKEREIQVINANENA